MGSGKKDRWRYQIYASDNHGWVKHRSGWQTGEPMIEEKAAKLVAKQAIKILAKQLAGAPGSVVTISTAIGEAVGEPIGQLMKKGLNDVVAHSTSNALGLLVRDGISGVDVELTGDFEAKYRIEVGADIRDLICLLSVVPATFGTDDDPYYMVKSVVQACYLLQVDYLRSLTDPSGDGDRGLKLTIEIDV